MTDRVSRSQDVQPTSVSGRTEAQSRSIRRAAIAGLVLGLCSLAIPAVIWLAFHESVPDDVVVWLVVIAALSCLAALFAVFAGIVGRRDPRGVGAIMVGFLGGLFSFLTFAKLAVTLFFLGMNAGL